MFLAPILFEKSISRVFYKMIIIPSSYFQSQLFAAKKFVTLSRLTNIC